MAEGWVPVGVVGAGNMARALVAGWLAAGWPARRITVTNRRDDGRLAAMAALGVAVTRSKADLCAESEVVVVAVKPADAAGALAELGGLLGRRHLVLSLMAGVPTAAIEGALGGPVRVVRAMPNVSSAVRESATGLAAGHWAKAADLDRAAALLAAVGQVENVPESALAAVTAVAGSGPAYVYLLLEALAAAGRAVGLDGDLAGRLAVQTVFGSAKLVHDTARDPAELRRSVTSPGGTTAAALAVLEAAGFADTLAAAVARATQRAGELAGQWAGAGERPAP